MTDKISDIEQSLQKTLEQVKTVANNGINASRAVQWLEKYGKSGQLKLKSITLEDPLITGAAAVIYITMALKEHKDLIVETAIEKAKTHAQDAYDLFSKNKDEA